MTKLNANERRALNVIIDTCDDLDRDLFTRLIDAAQALMDAFDGNGQVAGGYIADLMKKGYLDLEEDDFYGAGLWVNPL